MSKAIFLKPVAVWIALMLACYSHAQTDTLNKRIFLIGDAGELAGTEQPVIDWLKDHVNWNDEKNTAIFLGDNIYPLGMPMPHTETYQEAKRILDY